MSRFMLPPELLAPVQCDSEHGIENYSAVGQSDSMNPIPAIIEETKTPVPRIQEDWRGSFHRIWDPSP